MRYDYLIVGAGLFGAVCAERLRAFGKRCLVIEKNGFLGGMAATESTDGILTHRFGAHIFHTSDEEVWRYMNRFCTFRPYRHRPLAKHGDRYYPLPFDMDTFEALWGVRSCAAAREKIAEQTARYAFLSGKNAEEYALKTFGEDIYTLLIRDYTEKQWGRPCKEIAPEVLKRIPLRFTYGNDYFCDRYQGIPEGGYTALTEKMLCGTEVRTETEFSRFFGRTGDVFGKIIYSGSLDELFDGKWGVLPYRTVRFEWEMHPKRFFQRAAVINDATKEAYTRCVEHKYFDGADVPYTWISREYPKERSDGEERYYPVIGSESERQYRRYAEAARQGGILFGGRLGEYRYYNMDQTVRSALNLMKAEGVGYDDGTSHAADAGGVKYDER